MVLNLSYKLQNFGKSPAGIVAETFRLSHAASIPIREIKQVRKDFDFGSLLTAFSVKLSLSAV